MKKDDDPFIITRQPRATGDANERQMLDMIHDSRGLRTIIRRGADGSTVRCRTRAGFVEFVVEDPTQDTSEEGVTPLFLETGSTQYPGAQTLLQYNGLSDGQGRWWFKVSAASNWLGYISDAVGTQSDRDNGKLYGKYGGAIPPANATLYDGMISPATSLPTVYANNSSWINAMLTKRKAIVTCPASMFSGKMRLFMQARYGALLSPSQDIQSDDAFGVIVDGLPLSNLGGVGVGIFTTEQKEHFVIKISGTTVNFYRLKPIKAFTEIVKKLRAKLSALPAPSQAEQEKLEAYIFAGSYIDTEVYKSYPGVAASCSPAVYGWSFNWNGTKTDVIDIQISGAGPDAHFLSTHYSLRITHNKSGTDDNFTFALDTISSQHWRDGRGRYHIFVPDYTDGGRMVWMTINNTSGYVGRGKVHCFYNKSDELIVAEYDFGNQTQTDEWFETDANWPYGSDQTNYEYIAFSTVSGRRAANYKLFGVTTHGTESFSVNGMTFGGTYRSGHATNVDIRHGMGCSAAPLVRPMKLSIAPLTGYGLANPITGWGGTYCDAYTSDTFIEKANWLRWTEESLGRIRDSYETDDTRVFHTLVIPFFDCCSVFVYERDATESGVVSVTRDHQTSYYFQEGSCAISNVRYAPPPGGVGENEGPVLCNMPDFIGNDNYQDHHFDESTEYLTKDLGPPRYSLGLFHFHGGETNVPTESDSVLYSLFYVDVFYPYVAAQIWTSVNVGGGSAYQPVYNPDQDRRWTGWA